MNKNKNDIERIRDFPKSNLELLNSILNYLKGIIKGKRKIMYSDIINHIIRKGYKGEEYNQLILWCNYKIRVGEIFIDFRE